MKWLILVFSLFCVSESFAQILPAIKEKLIIEKNSVSNKDWSEYIHFMKNDPAFTKEYIHSMLPDNWKIKDVKKLNEQPVSGVSWYQAGEFCKWRSVLATYQNTHSEKASYTQMLNENKTANTVVTCRLPTENEFNKFAASSGNTKKESVGFRCVIESKRTI